MSIDDVIARLQAKAKQEEQDHIEDVTRKLRLPEHAAKAKARVDLIARRATEVDNIQKETTIAPAARATILAGPRAGLQTWFDAVDAAQADLHGQTFGTQSALQKALHRYERMTVDDLSPRPGQQWIINTLGRFSPYVWRLYNDLGNIRPAGDIDEAIGRLKVAFAELTERLEEAVV